MKTSLMPGSYMMAPPSGTAASFCRIRKGTTPQTLVEKLFRDQKVF